MNSEIDDFFDMLLASARGKGPEETDKIIKLLPQIPRQIQSRLPEVEKALYETKIEHVAGIIRDRLSKAVGVELDYGVFSVESRVIGASITTNGPTLDLRPELILSQKLTMDNFNFMQIDEGASLDDIKAVMNGLNFLAHHELAHPIYDDLGGRSMPPKHGISVQVPKPEVPEWVFSKVFTEEDVSHHGNELIIDKMAFWLAGKYVYRDGSNRGMSNAGISFSAHTALTKKITNEVKKGKRMAPDLFPCLARLEAVERSPNKNVSEKVRREAIAVADGLRAAVQKKLKDGDYARYESLLKIYSKLYKEIKIKSKERKPEPEGAEQRSTAHGDSNEVQVGGGTWKRQTITGTASYQTQMPGIRTTKETEEGGAKYLARKADFLEFFKRPEFEKTREFLNAFIGGYGNKDPAHQVNLCLDRIKKSSDYNERVAAFMILLQTSFSQTGGNTQEAIKRSKRRAELCRKAIESLDKETTVPLLIEILKDKNMLPQGNHCYEQTLCGILAHRRESLALNPVRYGSRLIELLSKKDKKALITVLMEPGCSSYEYEILFKTGVKNSDLIPHAKDVLREAVEKGGKAPEKHEGLPSQESIGLRKVISLLTGSSAQVAGTTTDPETDELIKNTLQTFRDNDIVYGSCVYYFTRTLNLEAIPLLEECLEHYKGKLPKCRKKTPGYAHRIHVKIKEIEYAIGRIREIRDSMPGWRDVQRSARNTGGSPNASIKTKTPQKARRTR